MIILKTQEEVRGIWEAGKIVAATLAYVRTLIRPGVSLKELDRAIDRFIRSHGGRPAFLGYRGFPASSCISLNHEVVHGIPDGRRLRPGDLVKVDVGVEKDGFYADGAYTYIVEDGETEIPARVRELVRVTREALYEGIRAAVPGNHLSDIGHAIEKKVRAHGFSPVKKLAGHGVGLKLHEDPLVPNYGKPGRGPLLKPGMVLAIEPMINMGGPDVYTLDDGWTEVTADGSLSAHFEHTVYISERGPIILTQKAR